MGDTECVERVALGGGDTELDDSVDGGFLAVSEYTCEDIIYVHGSLS